LIEIVPGKLTASASETLASGDLVQTGKGDLLLSVSRSDGYGAKSVLWVNLANGKLIETRPQEAFVQFKNWTMILPPPFKGAASQSLLEWRA
jgi:hypothetical protein